MRLVLDEAEMFHLIEYRAEVLNALHDLVAHLGYGVRRFETPVDYLKYMRSPDYGPPTALIAANRMPHMNGQQLTAEVRKTHPNLKVVLTTSLGSYEVGEEVRQSICSILYKPFEIGFLATLLATLKACDSTTTSAELQSFISTCPIRVARACPHQILHGL